MGQKKTVPFVVDIDGERVVIGESECEWTDEGLKITSTITNEKIAATFLGQSVYVAKDGPEKPYRPVEVSGIIPDQVFQKNWATAGGISASNVEIIPGEKFPKPIQDDLSNPKYKNLPPSNTE